MAVPRPLGSVHAVLPADLPRRDRHPAVIDDAATILKLVLLLGVVLLVMAIGLRARFQQPMLLLRQPALGLRAMAAMYVALPAFVLVLVWLMPLREGVGAALLGIAISPVLPPWAKKGTAVGGQGTLVVTVAVVVFGLLAGHWLGGPDPGNRGALASGAFLQHQAAVMGTVLLHLIVALGLADASPSCEEIRGDRRHQRQSGQPWETLVRSPRATDPCPEPWPASPRSHRICSACRST